MAHDDFQIDTDPESELMTLDTLLNPGTRCDDE